MYEKTINIPYFQVQSDWNYDILEAKRNHNKDKPEAFWVSLYELGGKSIHGKVQVEYNKQKDEVELHGNEGIDVEYYKQGYLKLGSRQRNIEPVNILLAKKEIQTRDSTKVTSFDVDKEEQIYLCGKEDGVLELYDNQTKGLKLELKGHYGDVNCCRLFPSGKVAISGGMDMSLKIWSVESGINPVTLFGHRGSITDVQIIGIGKNVLSSSKDGTVILWNCGDSRVVQSWTFEEDVSVNKICLKPASLEGTESQVFVACSSNGAISLCDISSKNPSITMKTVTKSDIAALSVSKEGTYIAGGDEDGIVHIWDVRKPTEHLLQIQRDLYPITSMCSIHTEKQDLIAVGSQNGSLYTINGFGFGFADSRDRGNESYENSGSSKLTGIKTDTEFVGFGSGAINGIKCLYGGHRNLLNDYTLHVTAGCDGSIYKI